MICGLLDHDPGLVKAAIGYVPQDVALYPDLSGLENLRFWGRMYGLAVLAAFAVALLALWRLRRTLIG